MLWFSTTYGALPATKIQFEPKGKPMLEQQLFWSLIYRLIDGAPDNLHPLLLLCCCNGMLLPWTAGLAGSLPKLFSISTILPSTHSSDNPHLSPEFSVKASNVSSSPLSPWCSEDGASMRSRSRPPPSHISGDFLVLGLSVLEVAQEEMQTSSH